MTDSPPRMPIAEYRCPACGVVLPAAEAEEAPSTFHCPHCQAHVQLRDGHLHLVFEPRAVAAGRDEDADESPATDE